MLSYRQHTFGLAPLLMQIFVGYYFHRMGAGGYRRTGLYEEKFAVVPFGTGHSLLVVAGGCFFLPKIV